MNIKIMARGIGYLLVGGVLFGAGIALSNRQYPTAETSRTEPSPAAAALDAELAHCQAIGPEAADDAACKALGEADRSRFVESGKLYRDRATDSVLTTHDVNEPESPFGNGVADKHSTFALDARLQCAPAGGRYRGATAMNTGVIDRFTEVFTRFMPSRRPHPRPRDLGYIPTPLLILQNNLGSYLLNKYKQGRKPEDNVLSSHVKTQ